MTSSAPGRARPPRRPLAGAPWFAARFTLAVRRTRRFLRWWLAVGGALAFVALLVPVARQDPGAEARAAAERAAADSLRTGARLAQLRTDAAVADTALRDAVSSLPRRRPAAPVPSDDPRVASLRTVLNAARAAPTVAAYLAVADDEAVRYGPRMRALADSLQRTDSGAEQQRLGRTILAIADYRHGELSAASAPEPAPAPAPSQVDTAALRAAASAAADSVGAATQRHERARAAATAAADALERGRAVVPPVSPGLLVLGVMLLGLLLRVGTALLREMRAPTIAHPLEAERAIGAPVLSLVRVALPDGPLRFRPSGVDPFRVLYLGLTSTGTRTRAVLVVAEDSVIASVAAARLAVAASADHRSTLVADLDTDAIALARVFRDHPEPGVSDAVAGAFEWREVARAVGSSDGLNIAMIPAGTTRDPASAEQWAAAAEQLTRFREKFEFTILAVGLSDLDAGRQLLPAAPIVLTASVGVTPIDRFIEQAALIESRGDTVHSLVMWDAPRPSLPSRAELAAQLSKRRGRTPGGSFKAVQEATKKPL